MKKKFRSDAGHGLPTDPGAIGNGIKEAEKVFEIQEKVIKFLNDNYTGLEISRTRSDNKTFVGLSQRANNANNIHADIFISFHNNSAANTSARGYEDFIYTKASSNSVKLQNTIHEKVIPVLKKYDIPNRGKRRANYAVLRQTSMPAVLIETLFVSNSTDAKLLKDDKFLNDICKAYAEGIASYLNLQRKPIAVNDPIETSKPEPIPSKLPDVASFASTPIRVVTTTDAGVYKYANISGKERVIKKGTRFKVYGHTHAAWAVNGGFVQMQDVEPVTEKIHTGGVNQGMQNELKDFMKSIEKDTTLVFKAEGGNPYAEIEAKGLNLVKVLQFLKSKGWYYKNV